MIRIAGELLGLGVTRIEPAGNSVAPVCDRDAQAGARHDGLVQARGEMGNLQVHLTGHVGDSGERAVVGGHEVGPDRNSARG